MSRYVVIVTSGEKRYNVVGPDGGLVFAIGFRDAQQAEAVASELRAAFAAGVRSVDNQLQFLEDTLKLIKQRAALLDQALRIV